MKLFDAVVQLRHARAAHKAWVARAEGLVAGLPLEKEQVPLLPTDCQFGKWYDGSAQSLRKLPAYQQLEKPHDQLHRVYMQIFKLLYDEPDVSGWARFLGQGKKVKAENLKKAEELLKPLRHCSDEVCALLERLEEQVALLIRQQQVDQSVITKQF